MAASCFGTFQRQQRQKLLWQPSSGVWCWELFWETQIDCLFGSYSAFVSYLCPLVSPFCLNKNHGILPSAAKGLSNPAQQSCSFSVLPLVQGGLFYSSTSTALSASFSGRDLLTTAANGQISPWRPPKDQSFRNLGLPKRAVCWAPEALLTASS